LGEERYILEFSRLPPPVFCCSFFNHQSEIIIQMLLPWEYGVRNLARRPVRTALTLVALATVVMLVFVVVGFIRGLEQSLAVSGDVNVVLVYSVNSEENIENSSIPARTPSLLTASLDGTVKRFGVTHVSPEL